MLRADALKAIYPDLENHIVVTRALAGESDRTAIKLKPADYADYLIHNTLR